MSRFCTALGIASALFVSVVSTGYAECPGTAADKDAIDCSFPTTPCDPTGKGLQFPGEAISGQNCGNSVTTIVIGPIVVAYSSMNKERRGTDEPVYLRNYGFGQGVFFGQRISETKEGLELYHPSGSKTLYVLDEKNIYLPADRFRGNLMQLVKDSNTRVRLTDVRSKAVTYFERNIVAQGQDYLPKRLVDTYGFETEIQYHSEASGMPSLIRDKNTGHTITFQTDGKGLVTSVTNADNVVTKLSYDGEGFLTKVTQADGASTEITYTGPTTRFIKLIINPSTESQANTYYRNGVIKSTTRMRLNKSTNGVETLSRITFKYSPTDIIESHYADAQSATPVRFLRTTFADTDWFGPLISETYAANGAYNADSNAGIRLSRMEFGKEKGESLATYDRFGIGAKLTYAKSGSCAGGTSATPEMPVPTCIKSPMGEVSIAYSDKFPFRPQTVTERNAEGAVIRIVEFSRDANGNVTSQSVKNANNETVASVAAQFDSLGFPTEITTTSSETARYDSKYQVAGASLSDGSIISLAYDQMGRVNQLTKDGETQTISTAVQDGGTQVVSQGRLMSLSSLTSFDGLGSTFTLQRVSGQAALIPSLSESWGGLAGDQSARASFDISSLKRDATEDRAPSSQEHQLLQSGVADVWGAWTEILPTQGVRTVAESATYGPNGSLTNRSEQMSLFPSAQKAADAAPKRKRQTTIVGRTGTVVEKVVKK